jgi:hypothetical protein
MKKIDIMIKKYQIYKFKVPFIDSQGGKERPSVIVGISNNNKILKYFGIYSYKKWWNEKPDVYKCLFAIRDTKSAGLTMENSYINISNQFAIDISKIKSIKFVGELSDIDKALLENQLELYFEHMKVNGEQKTFLQILNEHSKEMKHRNLKNKE